MNNIKQAYARFLPAGELFRCPLCASGLRFANENSLLCDKGHCFDLSKRGYINFAPGQGAVKNYTRALFESRREIFRAGFYEPLIERLKLLMSNYSRVAVNILDAGCGEGFFISALCGRGGMDFAMDISKDAIALAAGSADIKWLVGDLANIPLRTGAAGLLLNILAPANYGEFARVLEPGGILIKVIPGARYLEELRSLSGAAAYSNEHVLSHFCGNTCLLERSRLFYQMPVTERQSEQFYKMTPLVSGHSISPRPLSQITVELEILVGKNFTP